VRLMLIIDERSLKMWKDVWERYVQLNTLNIHVIMTSLEKDHCENLKDPVGTSTHILTLIKSIACSKRNICSQI